MDQPIRLFARALAARLAGAAEVTPEFTLKQLLARADDVSMALVALLERLPPEARAAFMLREVFDADYAELAAALGKSEAACRELVDRARAQLRESGP